MTDDSGMGECHDVPRRELDHFFLARLDRLTERIEDLDTRVQAELQDLDQRISQRTDETRQVLHVMTANIQRIFDRQHAQEPALDTLRLVVSAGLAMKWIIVTVIGVLAAVGTAATAWDALSKWRGP